MITGLAECVIALTMSSLGYAFLWALTPSQERDLVNRGLLYKRTCYMSFVDMVEIVSVIVCVNQVFTGDLIFVLLLL